MNRTHSEHPILERVRQRLSQSRYFTISLLLHAVLLAVLGTMILHYHQKPEGFVPVGEVAAAVPDYAPPAPPTDEKPPERVENRFTEASLPPAPPTNPGKPTRMDFPPVTTDGLGKFAVRVGDLSIAVDVPAFESAPSHLPANMLDRYGKNRNGTIASGKWLAGRPRPTDATENAVMHGLRWLRDHRNVDGSWGTRHKGAMTGLALLCFLGHGETGESPEFGLAVNEGINWILKHGTDHRGRLSMTADGWGPGNGGVYEHAIVTYALGEYYTMTRDERVVELLKQAVGYIVAGQGPDGGWMYHYDKTQGDTSVSGWQVQALKAAHLTGLPIPGVTGALDQAMKNLDRVQGPNGGYGYRGPEDRYSLTGVGVLCELFWKESRNKDLRQSVKFILEKSDKEFPVQYQGEKADLYAWYYHTQALLMFGGTAWREWEKKVIQEIVKAQTLPAGDWPVMRVPAHGNLQNSGELTGQVYRTTLCILMLESYYRYMPVHRAEVSEGAGKWAAK